LEAALDGDGANEERCAQLAAEQPEESGDETLH
jgi:hypothetical protein